MREIAVLKAIGFSRRRRVRHAAWPRRRCSRRSPARSARVASLGLSQLRARGVRRLEPGARARSRLHRHQRDPRAGPVPGVLRRHDLGRRAVVRRGAARRRRRRCARCSERGAAARATASATCSRAARAPRSRVGVIALVVIATTLLLGARLEPAAHARHHGRRRDNLIVLRKGSDQRRLERAAARGLPGAALSSRASRGRRRASRSSRPSSWCSRSSARATAGARTCSCAASSRSRSPCTTTVRIVEGRMFEPVAGRGDRRARRRRPLSRARSSATTLEFGRGTLEGRRHLRERRLLVRERGLGRRARARERREARRCPTRASACAPRPAPTATRSIAPHRRRPALGARGAARDRLLRGAGGVGEHALRAS